MTTAARLMANWLRTASPDTLLVMEVAGPVIQQIAKEIESMTVENKAYLIGRAAGLITFETLLSMATVGSVTAVKAAKASDTLFDISKFDFVPDFKNASNLRGILQKFSDKLAVVLDTKVCFVAGTPVATPDGLKPIEELSVGDLVLTRNEFAAGDDSDNGYESVTELITTHPSELLELTFSDGDSEETLTTTPNHPFYSLDTKGLQDNKLPY